MSSIQKNKRNTILFLADNGMTDEEICNELNITLKEYKIALNEEDVISETMDYLY